MRIYGYGTITYLYLNGLAIGNDIRLSESVTLSPAKCELDKSTIEAFAKSETELGVLLLYLRNVSSQLVITAEDSESLATSAWNSLMHVTLLGALFNTEIENYFQASIPAQDISKGSSIDITNMHLRGASLYSPKELDTEEMNWLRNYYDSACSLMSEPSFDVAVSSLSNFHWHSHPRVQLAVLWAGIEALFGVDTELSFRLSQYIARFLHPEDKEGQLYAFEKAKTLYKHRSNAVHGSRQKGEPHEHVGSSNALLWILIRRCVERGALPNPKELAP